MKRLFWFSLGIGAAAFAVVKGRQFLHKLTPTGMSEQVAERGKNALDGARTFWSDLTHAMDEREAELRAELKMTPKN